VKSLTLDEVVDAANKLDFGRARETAVIVKEILTAERARQSGLRMMGNMAYLPKGGNAIVVGDLHGDESSLIKILKETNFVERVEKGEKLTLVALGDYIDRGPQQVEVVNLLLELKRNFRDNVVMLRGDHEIQPSSPDSPGARSFLEENIKKYNDFNGGMYRQYFDVFGRLPLAAKSENGILFFHGGVSDKINEAKIAYGGSEIEKDIVWNDGRENIDGMAENTNRGIGKFFGPSVYKGALDRMNCKIGINAHEPLEEDRIERFGGKLLTINSSEIIRHMAYRNYAVGYGYVSLEAGVESVGGVFHSI
jgi:protein phosphatase